MKTALIAVAFTAALHAQYAAPPAAYSVTEINAMMGAPVTMKIDRDGSKVLVDQSFSGHHSRTLYDLQTHANVTWDLADASVPCTNGRFSGDWGDPFAASAEILGDLNKQHATPAGSETVNGLATKVLEMASPTGAKAKAWVDTKYGLVMKLEMGGQTMLEIKQIAFAAPAASTFVLPAACAGAARAPLPQTDAERIAAETGGKAEDYANGIMPPASSNSCSVQLKVVRAGSLQPIPGVHLTVDKTRQSRTGVLRIDNAPAQFNAEADFGNGGFASALIYRQCFAPQSTLLLVVKNPDKASDGADWLWVKK